MKFTLNIFLALTIFFSTTVFGEIVEIKIIHTNDIHGRAMGRSSELSKNIMMSGFGSLKTLINHEKLQSAVNGEHFFLFDMGDSVQGTIFGEFRQGDDILRIMKHLGYELWVLGNHEFDFGQDKLKDLIEKAGFPVLCANLKKRGKDGNLIDFDEFLKPYHVFNVNGIKIGIIGLTTPELLVMSVRKNVEGLHLLPTRETIRKNLEILKKLGVQIFILASHMGVEEDEAAAKEFPELDVIIGSHSHTFIEKPLVVNGVLIAQTGAYLYAAGKLTLKFDTEKKKVTMKNSQLLRLDHSKYPKNLRTEKILNELNLEPSAFAEQSLGTAEVDLLRTPPGLGQLPADEVREKFFTIYRKSLTGFYQDRSDTKPTVVESNLCNLITDIMKNVSKADIAMVNPGGVRENILKGSVRYQDVFQVVPFANSISTCLLTGAQVTSILKKSATLTRSGGMMFVSGLTFTINPSKRPEDQVSDIMHNGRPLNMDQMYRIATTNFTMMGGDGFEEFTQGKDPQDTGIILREELKEYFIKHSPVSYSLDGRVTLKSEK